MRLNNNKIYYSLFLLFTLLILNDFITKANCYDEDDEDDAVEENERRNKEIDENDNDNDLSDNDNKKRSLEEVEDAIPHKVITNTENDKLLQKRMKKRSIVTIDGVVIASSYKEFIDLASIDFENRLRKQNLKSNELEKRLNSHMDMFNKILEKSAHRREYAKHLSKKVKTLRQNLILNTRLKKALINLAEIAGYDLDSLKSDKGESTSLMESNDDKKLVNLTALSHVSKRNLKTTTSILNQTSATQSSENIQKEYAKVEEKLIEDKRELIQTVHNIKDNEEILQQLENNRIKIQDLIKSLKHEYKNLNEIIRDDTNVSNMLHQLKVTIEENEKVREKLLATTITPHEVTNAINSEITTLKATNITVEA